MHHERSIYRRSWLQASRRFVPVLVAALMTTGGCHGGSRARAQPGAAAQLPRPSAAPLFALVHVPTEYAERLAFSGQVLALLRQGKYADLDALADRIRVGKERFRNGSWRLRQFYLTFYDFGDKDTALRGVPQTVGSEEDWKQLLDQLGQWVTHVPRSATARICRAYALVAYAFKARGSGWASKVKPEDWVVMNRRLDEAGADLEAAQALKTRCPGWWGAAQTVALLQGWDRERYSALVSEAIALEPEYHAFYDYQAYYLLPRWHGKEGEWDRVLRAHVARLGSPLGEEIYARVLWYLRETRVYGNVLEQAGASWPVAKAGFIEMQARWPDSLEVTSTFCLLSGHAGDRAQCRKLFEQIGARFDTSVWRKETRFWGDRVWAFTVVPPSPAAK
jgi:hypothetical protein